MFSVSKSYEISIAHTISGHESCGRRHGHNITLTLEFQGRLLNESGMVIDFHDIDKIAKPTIELLDHSEIIPNVHPPDYRGEPSMENIAIYVYGRVLKSLQENAQEILNKYGNIVTVVDGKPILPLPELQSVTISETKNNTVKYWRS